MTLGLNHHNVAVFDGHNDLLTRLWLSDQADSVQAFIHEQLSGQLDLKRCQQAGFAGGIFAIFLPPFAYVKQHHPDKLFDQHADDFTQPQIEQICGLGALGGGDDLIDLDPFFCL